MQKILIVIGAILVVIGILWPWLKRLNLGHLPGDIIIKRDHFSFYFPIVTCVVLSLLISLIFWLINK